jgi:hypothetical protein
VLSIAHEDATIVRVDGGRLWKQLWTPSRIMTWMVTCAGSGCSRILAQEERAATPGERLAVRGQAACNPARLRTASAGTRKFAGHIGRWKLAAGEKARHRGPAGMQG